MRPALRWQHVQEPRVSIRGLTSKPVIGDAHGMQPPNGRTAPQLQDADVSERPQLREFIGEMEHAIDHRVLWKEPACPLSVCEKQHGACREVRQCLNLVQEFLELAIGRRWIPARKSGHLRPAALLCASGSRRESGLRARPIPPIPARCTRRCSTRAQGSPPHRKTTSVCRCANMRECDSASSVTYTA